MQELRRVRSIFTVLQEREQVKAEIARCSASIFQILGQPFSRLCQDFVSNLMSKVDRAGYFVHPVPADLFPDYLVVVENPMDFSTILKQIAADRIASPSAAAESLFYPSLAHFYADLRLIPENARLYNTTTSVFYLAAERLEAYMKQFFKVLHSKLARHGVFGPFDALNLEASPVAVAEAVDLNWDDFLANLPLPTPARFGKPAPKPLLQPSNLKSASSNSLSISGSTMKRRGRPPKNRSISSSLGSGASAESLPSVSSSSSGGSLPKKRGRPPKLSPIIAASDEEEKDPLELANSREAA